MTTPTAFAAALVAEIERLARERGLSHSDLARAAFPQAADPVGRWRKIRNHGQNLLVADAHRLAHAVGTDLPSLCFMAQG